MPTRYLKIGYSAQSLYNKAIRNLFQNYGKYLELPHKTAQMSSRFLFIRYLQSQRMTKAYEAGVVIGTCLSPIWTEVYFKCQGTDKRDAGRRQQSYRAIWLAYNLPDSPCQYYFLRRYFWFRSLFFQEWYVQGHQFLLRM